MDNRIYNIATQDWDFFMYTREYEYTDSFLSFS